MGMRIACLTDPSTHGGTIVSSGQSGSLTVAGVQVAVEGAQHYCPQDGHGTTAITPVTICTYHEGKRIVTELATAGCGAVITPPDRMVYVE